MASREINVGVDSDLAYPSYNRAPDSGLIENTLTSIETEKNAAKSAASVIDCMLSVNSGYMTFNSFQL